MQLKRSTKIAYRKRISIAALQDTTDRDFRQESSLTPSHKSPAYTPEIALAGISGNPDFTHHLVIEPVPSMIVMVV